jgi:hypothetical protein
MRSLPSKILTVEFLWTFYPSVFTSFDIGCESQCQKTTNTLESKVARSKFFVEALDLARCLNFCIFSDHMIQPDGAVILNQMGTHPIENLFRLVYLAFITTILGVILSD